MSALRIIRITAWLAVVLLLGAVAGVGGTLFLQQRQTEASKPPIEAAKIGGPFSLVSHKGETIDNARLAGKPYLVFFGFTHCPDICPTTLFELTELMKELGPAADRFNALFITVDPQRDSQQLLAEYMVAFDERILAVRGSREQTDAAVKAFAAFARRVPVEGGDYTMDHTAGVYVMNAEGRFANMLDMHESREVRLGKLRRIAGAGD